MEFINVYLVPGLNYNYWIDDATQFKNKFVLESPFRRLRIYASNDKDILIFRLYINIEASEYLQITFNSSYSPKYISFLYGNNGSETDLIKINAS